MKAVLEEFARADLVISVGGNFLYAYPGRNSFSYLKHCHQILMAQLMGISLGVKHEAYSNEREVRLVIFGTSLAQKDHVKTRIRGPEIVPYMESDLPLRDKGGIVDIVVGPAAAPTAKDAVQRMLHSFSIESANLIRESDIPYRAL